MASWHQTQGVQAEYKSVIASRGSEAPAAYCYSASFDRSSRPANGVSIRCRVFDMAAVLAQEGFSAAD